MLDLVKEVLERVEQLHCSVDDNSDIQPRSTEDFFTQPETVEVVAAVPAPSLQQFYFHSNRYRPWILEALFGGIAPNLRNVQLSYVSIPWRLLGQAKGLETVIIDCAPHLPSPFDILYIFKHCPNLLKFHIRRNDAASFVVISEPVWYEPLQIPCPQVLASASLQSFVAAELPVPGLHYILEHLTFPQSASIDISIKQALGSQTPLPIPSLIILSDVISVTEDSHIELWITGHTIEVRDQDIKVRFHNAISAGNYHEVLLAVPSNMRNGVARVLFHSQLNLQEAREFLAAVTSLFSSISQMECWCEAAWTDLLTDVGIQIPQLQRFTLIFKCNGMLLPRLSSQRSCLSLHSVIESSVPEVSQTSQAPLTSENLCQENLKAFREVRSRLPRMIVEGYEMKHGGHRAPS